MLRCSALFGKPGGNPGFWVSIWLLFGASVAAPAQEFRGLWVDAWGAGFRTAAEVTQLIADARAGNFNAVVVEIRKRGDAYYDSNYEPEVTPNFDSLADLISKAHNTNNGQQRIEIHAWIVTYPVRRLVDGTNSAPADHVLRLHPDWLMTSEGGDAHDGSNFNLDPGHPEVQKHTFNVCMDIIARYDIDGFNFDYIRYPGNVWGYNPVSVDRFNRRFGRAGVPSPTDPAWLQFRRDQVTALVRKVYLSSAAIKPRVTISADTITWAPYPDNVQAWTNSSGAYASVLQDWRSWMQEGILDLNIPMTYFRMHTHPTDWFGWCNFIRDHQYNRQAAIGPGIYLNTFSNTLFQMRHTRAPSPAGNTAVGVVGYDYGQPSNDGTSRATFLDALTKTNVARLYDPNPEPLFVNRAAPPVMPWKTAPTKGHLKGFVYLNNTNTPIDGASFTITGPNARNGISDATGFYGNVDLAPGTYTVSASAANAVPASSNITVVAGAVTTLNFILAFSDTSAPAISGIQVIDISDRTARIVWTTDEPADSVVEFGTSTTYDRWATNAALGTTHSLALSNLLSDTVYHYRVRSKDAASNQAASVDLVFQTNPEGGVSDLIIDNPQATIVGSWSIGNTAPGRYGPDYRYESPGTGANYVHFAPNILTAGNYAVYEWHSVGSNRTTEGPHVITHKNGTTTVIVNQRVNGGQWNLLGTFAFNAGTDGYVRITDAFAAASGSVVIADAIKFVFVPEPPVIVSQPANRIANAGQSASFNVVVGGWPPFTYQWRFNDTDIPGASSASLLVTNLDGFDAGRYRVFVGNLGGTALSSNATLTVLPSSPPAILNIQPLPNEFRINVAGDAGFHYTLISSSNLVDWSDAQSFQPAVNPFHFLETRATNTFGRFYKVRRD